MYDADYIAPPSTRQMNFARLVALRVKACIPDHITASRSALSDWIAAHEDEYRLVTAAQTGRYGSGASSRQVSYAEKIARAKRRAVPDECYRSAALMSRWIDANR